MPLYEYYCEQCNNSFEQIRPIAIADETIACPNCFNNQCKRKISKIAISGNNGSTGGNTSSCSGCTSHHCSTCH